MQQDEKNITLITPDAQMHAATHGGRAKCLQRLVRLDLPVPRTIALSFEAVHSIAAGDMPDMQALLAPFGEAPLLCVRPSSEDPDWGGPGAILNIGINDATYRDLSAKVGEVAAAEIYLRFVQSYAIHVARLDPDILDDVSSDPKLGLSQALRAYEAETEEKFPQDPAVQLAEVLRSMARAWEGTTARLLRQAKGAPVDAGLGLVVQELALGLGQGECGSGVIQLVNSQTGERQITGRYLSQSQGREALRGGADSLFLERDPRGRLLIRRDRVGRPFDGNDVQFLLPQMIDREIVSDLEQPGGKLVRRIVSLEVVQGADERLLCKVLGEFAVSHHAIDEREHRLLEADDEFACCALVAAKTVLDKSLVGFVGVSHVGLGDCPAVRFVPRDDNRLAGSRTNYVSSGSPGRRRCCDRPGRSW